MEKRKREDKEDIDNTRVKTCYVNEELSNKIPLDEEVEEFFIILGRAREAIKYFKKRVNVEDEEEDERRGHIEDFDGVDNNNGCILKREFEENHQLLDLNVDPVVDQAFCMVMRLNLDCNACCKKLKRHLLKMKEVETHLIEKEDNTVSVCGRGVPADVAIKIRRRMKRRVQILEIQDMGNMMNEHQGEQTTDHPPPENATMQQMHNN